MRRAVEISVEPFVGVAKGITQWGMNDAQLSPSSAVEETEIILSNMNS